VNVLGLTGKEPVIIMETQTFCSLCKRVVRRGDEAVTAAGRRGQWFIHPDCALSKLVDDHTKWFHQETVKEKNHKTRTRVQKKKVHESQGKTICSFCSKVVLSGDTFVTEDGKPFHNTGRNSCVIRFRRVVNNTFASLR
jgi:hypothetical protein